MALLQKRHSFWIDHLTVNRLKGDRCITERWKRTDQESRNDFFAMMNDRSNCPAHLDLLLIRLRVVLNQDPDHLNQLKVPDLTHVSSHRGLKLGMEMGSRTEMFNECIWAGYPYTLPGLR